MVNDLRKKKLKLRPVTYLSGTQSSGSNVPHGYMWSPHLVPKPKGSSMTNELTNAMIDVLRMLLLIYFQIGDHRSM